MPDPILDQTALDILFNTIGGDKLFFVEMIDTFLADSPKQIATMRVAAQNARAEELRRAAHSLKSNAASFGAQDLAKMAKELEEMGKRGETKDAAKRITQIEAEYTRVQSALGEISK